MAHKRKRIFDGLYAQLEETDGNVVLFSARGEPSVIFEITNPVQQLFQILRGKGVHRDKDFSYPYPGGPEKPVHPV